MATRGGTGRRRVTLSMAALVLLPLLPAIAHPASAYTPHAPIAILGDSGFVPGNGVVSGNGSPLDPFVISGWEIIPPQSTWGIEVRWTTLHFVIRDVYIHPAGEGGGGILLGDTPNAIVEQVRVEGMTIAIDLRESPGTVVRGSTLSASSRGIYVAGPDVRLEGNNISGYPTGVDLWYASAPKVIGNRLTSGASLRGEGTQGLLAEGNAFEGTVVFLQGGGNASFIGNEFRTSGGVLAFSHDGLVVESNLFLDGYTALNVHDSSGVRVRGNEIVNATDGVYFESVTDAEIAANNITRTEYGVYLRFYSSGRVYHNNFFESRAQSDGPIVWNLSYPDGGNYWGEYEGTDACRGPSQDVCPGPDLIGDAPYAPWGVGVNDLYPLMQPHGSPPGAPVALFTYSPDTPVVGSPATFDASGSLDLDGAIVSYAWTFGNDSGTGIRIARTFAAAGMHRVVLEVTDDAGLTTTRIRHVFVALSGSPPPPAGRSDLNPVLVGAIAGAIGGGVAVAVGLIARFRARTGARTRPTIFACGNCGLLVDTTYRYCVRCGHGLRH